MGQIQDLIVDYKSIKIMRHGADCFYWAAALSALNSLIVLLVGTGNFPFALGITQWVDGTAGGLLSTGTTLYFGLFILDLALAAIFVGFGYFARKGNDFAFVLGIFLYALDTLLVIGLREFWAFAFHTALLILLVQGLLASRHVHENASTY